MLHLLSAFAILIALALPSVAQQADSTMTPDRSATGGAQTLNDIMARQRGESVDEAFRRNATGDPDSGGWSCRPAWHLGRCIPIQNCGALCASALRM